MMKENLIWNDVKKVAIGQYRLLSRDLPEGTEEGSENISVEITDIAA
jgi:hypothetical protein